MFRVSARTVLELGSELISKDVIAFYELIKNAFDAESKNGVEIRFLVALARNSYLTILERARKEADTGSTNLGDLLSELHDSMEPDADPAHVAFIEESLSEAKSAEQFADLLEVAYREANYIEVCDTGIGMSRDDLINNYLVLGTPSRKKEVDRAVQARSSRPPFLGEKGIGRLSAMRLGEKLEISTARVSDVRLNCLAIDWSLFRNLDIMVEEVPVEPFIGKPKVPASWSGTQLRISDLNANWSERGVREIVEYDFARLIDPFLDPKERPRIAIFWNGTRIAIPSLDSTLLRSAHASFKGCYSVGGDGEPSLTCELEAIDLGFTHPREIERVTLALPDLEGALIGTSGALPRSALRSVGDFSFEAYWYNRRRLNRIESIGDQKAVRDLQRRWAGILLFRDNFRIFPYGDDEDDWLGLDRKALGRPGYSLNKAQFVGRVTISRVGNPALLDQTNREGLRSCSEQSVFVSALQHVIQALLLDFMKNVEKRYKSQKIDLGDVKAEVAQLESRAKNAINRIRKFAPKDQAEVVEDLQQAFFEFKELTEQAQKRIEEVEADSRQMVQMAGVGLMVEVVAHELARSSEAALGALESLRGKELPSEVRARLDTLRAEMKSVSKRLRILDPLSVSGRQNSEVFDLKVLLADIEEAHSAQFRRHRITFRIETEARSIRVRLVKGMVVQILENLISNSMYWIQIRAAKESRYLAEIVIRVDSDPLTLTYQDNGTGILPANRDKVFRPFWSLKEKTKRRGLGLFIAQECANYLGGRLTLLENSNPQTGRLHIFSLELPDGVIVK